jgi:Multicopper oxidase
VLLNDVDGYDRSLITTSVVASENQDGIARKTIAIPCGQTRRLRFINMSSHARFYVWFSDQRRFKIIELDGVSYTPQENTMFEIASGQRVSILVKTDPAVPATCTGAYIVVASDPRINHGTARCPMTFTRPDRPLQYVHGYLDISYTENGQPRTSSNTRKPVLDPTSADEVQDPNKFFGLTKATTSPSAPSATAGYHVTTNDWMESRLDFNFVEWRMLYYADPSAPNANTDYGFDRGTSGNRKNALPVGINGAHDYEMTPTTSIGPWNPPRPTGGKSNYIHYIKLRETENPRGFASMTENPRNYPVAQYEQTDPSEDRQLTENRWKHPDQQIEPATARDKTNAPNLPSLLRALRDNLSAADLKNPSTYESDTSKGRTLMAHDEDNEAIPNHWLVIRSERGDHPM